MTKFQVHDPATAPDGSKAILSQILQGFGFIPNLYGVMAEAPAVLQATIAVADIFRTSSLSPAA